jgi:hypothetical protein
LERSFQTPDFPPNRPHRFRESSPDFILAYRILAIALRRGRRSGEKIAN